MQVSVPVPCGKGPSASAQPAVGSSIWWIASRGPPHPPPHAWKRKPGSQPRQRMYEKSRCETGACFSAARSALRRWLRCTRESSSVLQKNLALERSGALSHQAALFSVACLGLGLGLGLGPGLGLGLRLGWG